MKLGAGIVTFLAILIFTGPYPLVAQTPSNYLNSATQAGPQTSVSHLTDTEDVNYENGALNISVPLLKLPGVNGLDLNLALLVSSKNDDLVYSVEPPPSPYAYASYTINWGNSRWSGPGIELGPGRLNIPTLDYTYQYVGTYSTNPGNAGGTYEFTYCDTDYIYTDESGAQHTFSNNDYCNQSYAQGLAVITTSDSVDGSFIRLDTSDPSDFKVYLKNGRVVHFAATGGQERSLFASSIVDPNGNTISFQPTATGVNITDTVGRQVSVTTSTAGSTITYLDSSGTQRSVSITTSAGPAMMEPITLTASSCTLDGNQPAGQPAIASTYTQNYPASTTTYSVATNTGSGSQVYLITEDALGEPTDVVYPAGGYSKYDYSTYTQSYTNGSFSCGSYSVRQVADKRQCSSSSGSCTSEDTTTYVPEVAYYNNSQMTVTEPANSNGIANKVIYTYSNANPTTPVAAPRELSRATYNHNSQSAEDTLLQSVSTTYYNYYSGAESNIFSVPSSEYGPYALPKTVTTTIYNANATLSSSVNYQYDSITLYPYGSLYGAASVYIDNANTITQTSFSGSTIKTTENTWDYSEGAHIWDLLSSSTVVDPSGWTSTRGYQYNATGNLTQTSLSGDGVSPPRISVLGRNSLGQLITETDDLNHVTTYNYGAAPYDSSCPNTSGVSPQPTSIVDALGHTEDLQYYSCTGLLATDKDVNGNTTVYKYDGIGRSINTYYPDGGVTSSVYSDAAPESTTTSVARDTEVSDNIVSLQVYDGLARVSHTQTGVGASAVEMDTQYDAAGNRQFVSNPYLASQGGTTAGIHYAYDALGRPILETNQDSTKKQWCYDGVSVSGITTCQVGNSPSGSTVDFYDENNNHWQQTYDSLSRLVKVLEPDPASGADTVETDYQLDAGGNVLDIDQWGGPFGNSGDRSRLYHYDGLSRLTSSQTPEAGYVAYSYNTASGALCSGEPTALCYRTDARNISTTYSYDSLDRLTKKQYSDGTLPVNFVYDETTGAVHPGGDYGFGIQSITNGIGRVTHEYVGDSEPGMATKMLDYDTMGRETAAWQCWDALCADTTGIAEAWQTYDLAGNMDYVNDGSGNGMYTSFDTAGRVTAVTTVPQPELEVQGFPAETLISSVQYGPAGPTQITLGDGQVESFGYDSRLRKSSYQRTNEANPEVLDYGYSLQYYPNGTLEAATEQFSTGSGTWQYSYDDLNRLSSAVNSAFGEGCSYSYDTWGNMTSEAPSGTGSDQCFSQSFSYGGTGAQNLNAISGLCYDASGNLLDDGPCPSSGAHEYAYDGEGRLASTDYGAETFVYDADGRRVGASNGSGGYANVLYNDITGEPLAQWTNDYQTGTRDLWVNGRHIGYFLNNSLTWTAGDWLGSERVRTNSSGNLIGAFENLPFGNGQTTLSGSDNDVIHFTGRERDTVANDVSQSHGLDYLGARFYSADLGRFMSPDPSQLYYADPANPQSLNMYSYAQNNPLTNTDPTGLDCVYFNDAGNGIESIDHNSGSAECGSNGGDYVNGTVQSAQYFADSDTFGFRSSDSSNSYLTYANAPGNESDGTTCSGDCDTANGFFQSSNSLPDLTDDQRIQQLAIGVTVDSQHSFGCIAQAYGISGAGGASAAGLGAPTIAKPFAARGAAQGTSVASKGLAALANKAGVPRGRYPSPTGGLFSGGQEFKMMTSPNAGRALGRFVPYGVNAAATAYAVYQLGKCL